MSNGFAGVAGVEIENGAITIEEVWGAHAVSADKPYEVTLNWWEPNSIGNVHDAEERRATVFLDWREMVELADQLAGWVPGAKQHYEEEERREAQWQEQRKAEDDAVAAVRERYGAGAMTVGTS